MSDVKVDNATAPIENNEQVKSIWSESRESRGLFAVIDRVSESCSEWFNPILVKEARQALKSRQFLITFVLVLVAGWGWSFLAVTIYSPSIYYQPYGADLMRGYFWILAFPLIVMVPFGAFRSLAIEIEDGTFELVSVSTLHPRQIVGGKLASSMLQMMVYVSGLLPCIAFTYMLGGIESGLVGLLLLLSVVLTVSFSVAGLLLATISSQKSWQMVISVGFVLVLFVTFISASMGVSELLRDTNGLPIDDAFFWPALFALLSVVGSYSWLFYDAAAARITFPSENRATRLRLTMMLQQLLIVAWCSYLFMLTKQPYALGLLLFLSAAHWTVMGALMIGESANISLRSQRTIPESILGHALLAWFMPGPYTGYQFAILNMMGVALFTAVIATVAENNGFQFGVIESETATRLGFVAACYLAFYFGIARLFIAALAKITQTGPMLGFLIASLVILLGTLLPTLARTTMELTPRDPMGYWEITNPVSLLREHLFQATLSADERSRMRWIVYGLGGVTFLTVSMVGAWQVKLRRVAIPERVQLDDQEQQTIQQANVSGTAAHPLDD